jgi:hypothetical protein
LSPQENKGFVTTRFSVATSYYWSKGLFIALDNGVLVGYILRRLGVLLPMAYLAIWLLISPNLQFKILTSIQSESFNTVYLYSCWTTAAKDLSFRFLNSWEKRSKGILGFDIH